MKAINSLLGGACIVLGAVSLASCSQENPFIGEWKAVSPINITTSVPGAVSATINPTVTFTETEGKSGGEVSFTGDIDLLKDMMPTGQDGNIRVSGKGTFSVKGNWTYDVDDHDDLLLDIDYGSLEVKFDRAGMKMSGPGAMAVKDENRGAVEDNVATALEQEMRVVLSTDLARFSVINDVEVSKDRKVLGFEIHSPEQDLRFRSLDR